MWCIKREIPHYVGWFLLQLLWLQGKFCSGIYLVNIFEVEPYPRLLQTSKMQCFSINSNGVYTFTQYGKLSMLDICMSPGYASERDFRIKLVLMDIQIFDENLQVEPNQFFMFKELYCLQQQKVCSYVFIFTINCDS